MAEPESKLSKIGKEVVSHGAWHFTGAPLLETAGAKWRKWVISALGSTGAFIAGKITGIGWWWAAAVFCLTFGVFWFGWYYFRWRAVLAIAAAHSAPERARADSQIQEASLPTRIAGDPVQPVDPALKDAPALLVSYRRSPGGKTQLILSNEKSRTALVQRIGAIHGTEAFAAYYGMTVVPSTPHVPMGGSVSCELSGVANPYEGGTQALEDVLRNFSREGSASVVIDFNDADGREFSQQFRLKREANDSVIFNPDPVVMKGRMRAPPIGRQDLAALHFKLRLLSDARGKLEQVGRLLHLADQVELLTQSFGTLLRENDADKTHGIDLSKPLAREVLFLREGEDRAAINLYRAKAMAFAYSYILHRAEVVSLSGASDQFELPPQTPTESSRQEIGEALAKHGVALIRAAVSLESPYRSV